MTTLQKANTSHQPKVDSGTDALESVIKDNPDSDPKRQDSKERTRAINSIPVTTIEAVPPTKPDALKHKLISQISSADPKTFRAFRSSLEAEGLWQDSTHEPEATSPSSLSNIAQQKIPDPQSMGTQAISDITLNPSVGNNQEHLQDTWPVSIALAAGGIALVLLILAFIYAYRRFSRNAKREVDLETFRESQDPGKSLTLKSKLLESSRPVMSQSQPIMPIEQLMALPIGPIAESNVITSETTAMSIKESVISTEASKEEPCRSSAISDQSERKSIKFTSLFKTLIRGSRASSVQNVSPTDTFGQRLSTNS